jgi:c-di-GMP-binding flagellar brake protein YcgR
MPATRSRNTDWKRSLQQVLDRQRMLELAVARDDEPAGDGVDVIWRSQMIALHDTMIEVESPQAIGRTIQLMEGTKLVAAYVVGQNRFAFQTRVLPKPARMLNSISLFLAHPESITRCQRRHDRFDLQGLQLPKATLWPLEDAHSVSLAERANELAFEAAQRGEAGPLDAGDALAPTSIPISGTLMNVSGGGVGIQVAPADAAALGRHRVFWVRIPLGKDHPVPIVARGKLLHTHIDSMQNTYAGIVFDFSYNPAHQRTVAAQIARYVERAQAGGAAPPSRR